MSDKADLQSVLSFAVSKQASDVHLRVGSPPILRLKGELLSLKTNPFTNEDLAHICQQLMSHSATQIELSRIQEFDGSFEVQGLGRFRFNVFRHEGRLGVVLRVIPAIVPNLEQLGFKKAVREIASIERGFVLVTGSTGQGKSTTLAAMIDHINATRKCHIITIEDPIEFVHTPKRAKITQREVGRDTASFANALRSALRQDPDIILVGEMRDPESIDIALKASETGHVVFSTVHTTDAAKSVGRIVSMFPPEEQKLVRLRLADSLKATISQRLLTRADGKGRVVAQEIMVCNTAIAECIADEKRTAEIPIFIENAHTLLGSQTFQMHLAELYQNGQITLEVAKQASNNGADFEHALNFQKNEDNSWTGQNPKGKSTLQLESGSVHLEKLPGPGLRPPKEEDTTDNVEGLFTKVWNIVDKKQK